jgi:hypothetical protein
MGRPNTRRLRSWQGINRGSRYNRGVISALAIFAGALWAWAPLDPPVRWADDARRVGYCVNPNATRTGMSEPEIVAAIEAAAATWQGPDQGGAIDCAAAELVRRTDGCRPVTDAGDGVLNVHFVSDWSFGSATLGVTRYRARDVDCGSVTDDTGQPADLFCFGGADIELNDARAFWGVGGNVGADLISVAAHELGHALGLGHCSDNDTCRLREAVMHANYPGGTLRDAQPDDVEGLCALYPRRDLRTGAACAGDADCASGVCAAGRDGARFCSTSCPAEACGDGLECAADVPGGRTVCRPIGDGARFCAPCDPEAAQPCGAELACATDAEGGPTCLVRCDGGCPEGFTCGRATDARGLDAWVCRPGSGDCADPTRGVTPAAPLEACVDVPCAAPGACDGYCALPCDGAPDCADGEVCADRGGTSVCRPAVTEGAPCDDRRICAAGVCITGEPADPICHRVCAGGGACGEGQTCERRFARPGVAIDVCVPPPDVQPRPDAGAPDAASPADAGAGPPDASGGDAGPSLPDDPTCSCATGADCNVACPCDLRCRKAPVEGSCSCRAAARPPNPGTLIGLALLAALQARRRAARGSGRTPRRSAPVRG